MSGHTPGPWMVEGPSKPTADTPMGGDFAILDGGTNIIAETFRTVGVDSYRPAEANARLIAAAPELLGLLIKCRRALSGLLDEKRLAEIDAAITKATGAKP